MRSKGFLRAIPMFAVAALVLLTATSAWSAGYKVLYNFGRSSSSPSSGLIIDAQGNAYGTTSAGGYNNAGTVYELSPKTGYNLIYAFHQSGSGEDGGYDPQGNLVFDSAGNLYGTTLSGGTNKTACSNLGCGVVFKLSPAESGQPWTETVLYSFCVQANCADGARPQAGVIFDSEGNLYGTTYNGGNSNCQNEGPGCGTVFELSPNGLGWMESVIVAFSGMTGSLPSGNLIFDTAGNLYGTTSGGGNGNGGTVFELSPSGDGWSESVLYNFDGFVGSTDAISPHSGVIFDAAGNLYGTTEAGGAFQRGTVFELSPVGGSWVEALLFSFTGGNDGADPTSNLVLDKLGNLDGTTLQGGLTGCTGGCGTVFELMPRNGQWSEVAFRFPVSGQLGRYPNAGLLLDSAGNAYGTTLAGGLNGGGVVFRISD
jgi:uncharacterized repeat protein (TIGR03803 family)